jgi:GrpE
MISSFKSLGVAEYECNVGDSIDKTRMDIVDSKYSSDVPKGCVLEVLRSGMELNGNIVRPTLCIESLGFEEELVDNETEKMATVDDEPSVKEPTAAK